MLFELSMARAERILSGYGEPTWDDCLQLAVERQRQHYDTKISDYLEQCDLDLAAHAAYNLVEMMKSVKRQNLSSQLERSPVIPGLGWIASGVGDFALGPVTP